MNRIQVFLKELNEESVTTRNMLQIIPDDKYGWKPHEKSMTIQQLSTHIAELPTWITMALTTDELDFAAAPYEPSKINKTADLVKFFEESLVNGRTQLVDANEGKLDEMWTLRTGDKIHSVRTKAEVIRMALNQIVHHRAQLGVFLRLLNVPIPGSYGPSADDKASF